MLWCIEEIWSLFSNNLQHSFLGETCIKYLQNKAAYDKSHTSITELWGSRVSLIELMCRKTLEQSCFRTLKGFLDCFIYMNIDFTWENLDLPYCHEESILKEDLEYMNPKRCFIVFMPCTMLGEIWYLLSSLIKLEETLYGILYVPHPNSSILPSPLIRCYC